VLNKTVYVSDRAVSSIRLRLGGNTPELRFDAHHLSGPTGLALDSRQPLSLTRHWPARRSTYNTGLPPIGGETGGSLQTPALFFLGPGPLDSQGNTYIGMRAGMDKTSFFPLLALIVKYAWRFSFKWTIPSVEKVFSRRSETDPITPPLSCRRWADLSSVWSG